MYSPARKHKRFPVQFPVLVASADSGEGGASFVEATGTASSDLSREGLGIDLSSDTLLVPDTKVNVTLALEEEHDSLCILFEAKIAWVKGRRCGLTITRLTGENLELYENLLRALGQPE